MASLRGSSFGASHRVISIAARQQIRKLHMTGATSTPSQLLSRDPVSSVELSKQASVRSSTVTFQPTRHFNTTRSLKAVRDSSTIDFAYMPQFELETPSHTEILRIPLLPDNYSPKRSTEVQQEVMEAVMRPEISTVSANGTHIHSPSAMSEVTDNHSIEFDPYTLVNAVNTAAAKATGVPAEKLKEPGFVKQLWSGLLDDLLGGKKVQKP